ncbi:MAG: ABC transporter permease [Actinomycetota bacterium]
MNALRLLGKDLRLLLRTPALLAILVGYPVLVAVLVALALQGEERRPEVAFVNLDRSGRTVVVGGERTSLDDYVARFADEVHLRPTDAATARRALEDGRVAAVLTVPEGFVDNLVFGAEPPTVELVTSRRSAVRSEAITHRMESAVFRINQGLAADYIGQLLVLADRVVNGGTITVFGVSGEIYGITRSVALLDELRRTLRARGDGDLAQRLDPLEDFVRDTGDNLRLAARAASAIRSPVRLRVVQAAPGREPLSAFGVAGALLVSLGLVGVLLAASAISGEREDNVLVRLRRGLVSPGALVGEKIAFSALAGVAMGLVLLALLAVGTSLAIGRWGLWIPTLLVAGLAFGAFGVLVGALARETRTALLAGLMLALPLIFLGLVPESPAASAVSAAFAFGPAFEAFQGLIVEPETPSDLPLRLGHLALLAAAFGTAAALVLTRRESR